MDATGRRSFLQSLVALWAATAGRVSAAAESSRVALVIGNNGYAAVRSLTNAANDARAVSAVLAGAGFDVATRIDATGASMTEAVREFAAALERPQVKLAAFYYAGHGVQVDWRNYLLPVDARIRNLDELRKQAFDLGAVLAVLPKSGGKSFVIILDACRDNPFGATLALERGLTPFDAPVGTLIAFSTAPGGVASDGDGANGLYTENLVRELGVHGLRLEDAFKRVRVNVSLASRGAQVPWESTSLVGDVYVYPPGALLDAEQLERRFEEEVAYWNRMKGSKDPADWAGLLRAFPDGKLCEIAQARLNMLLAQSASRAPTRRLAVKPARIVLGDGRPVPEYFTRDANPNSAGSYPIDREFAVGDRAVYEGFDDWSGSQAEHFSRRVTRVDAEGDRVEFNDGKFVTDLLGNPVKLPNAQYVIPVQLVPAELQVGRRWSAAYRYERQRREFNEDMDFAIARRETITVPAGRFDAFRIEGRTWGVEVQQHRGRAHGARREELVLWEVPGLNFPVKEERTISHRDGRVERKGFELVSLRQGSGPN